LRDEGEWEGTEAIVFETGANEWRHFDRWPPPGVERTPLYFGADGTLSWDAPLAGTVTSDGASDEPGAASGEPGAAAGMDAYDEYVSDPDKPVPFSAEYRTTQGHLWMIEDQRFAATRPDVLVYESEVLTEDVTIAGPIIATLHASTSGTDSDWIVKLIDVFPGNTPNNRDCPVPMGDFQMLLAGEVFRAKFRNSFESPEPMVPGEPTRIQFDLRDRLSSSTCVTASTPSRRATASWCRYKAPGSRSSTATRRPSSTSIPRPKRTSRRRRRGSTDRRGCHRT